MARHTLPSIRMGQMSVARDEEMLRTLLGSCLGLALFERRRRVGGLAHIVLPESRGPTDSPARFVDTAIPALVEALENLAGEPLKLSAKLAGGADMFASRDAKTVGARNIEATERLLKELRIPVVARHLGGEKGRAMRLEAGTGRVFVDVVGVETVEI